MDFKKYKALDEPMVVKRNELILGRYALTTKSHKFFNALITFIDPFSSEIKPMVLKLTDIARILNVSSQAVYSSINDITNELTTLAITLEVSKKTWEDEQEIEIEQAQRENRRARKIKNPDNKSWKKVLIFNKIRYINKQQSVVFVDIHRDAAPFLTNLKEYFTCYYLKEILHVRSSYAVRLYEICRSMLTLTYVEKGKKVASKRFEYQEFRDVLGVKAVSYNVFSIFESKILKPAIESLRSTDLVFRYRAERVNLKRNPHAIIIATSVNQKNKIAHQINTDGGSWRLFIETFTDRQKEQISSYSDSRLKRNVEYFQQKNNEIAIKRPKSWVIKSITEDYAGIDSAEKLLNLDTISRLFIKEIIIPSWNTSIWEDEDRDAIASGTFDTETLEAQHNIFKIKTSRKQTNE